MLLYQTLEEATKSAQSVGLQVTIILIIVLALVAGFSLVLLWLLKKLDKKDEDLMKVIDARREDMMMMKDQMGLTAEAVKDGAREIRLAFSDFAREIRLRKEQ